MRVWIINDTEPLPTDSGNRRLMPIGMLCSQLARDGCDVRWIASSFEHYLKKQRPEPQGDTRLSENYRVTILGAPSYDKNVSLARVIHNRRFASGFAKFAASFDLQPDVIVTTVPTTETAHAVTRHAAKIGIPSVVIIHDLWPDFFADFTPPLLRPAIHVATLPLDQQVRYACRNATSLVGVSPRYLAWAQAKGGAQRSTTHDRVFHLGYQPEPAPAPEEALQRLESMGIPLNKHIVLFVGSWGATYDIDLLAKTAIHLADREDLVFVVTGDGSARPEIREKLARMSNVVLTGWINATQIASLALRATVGLLPYQALAPQGLPNKVFEYMAYGVYQVSTLTGEIQQLYAETGAGDCLPEATPEKLAHALSSAIDTGRATTGRSDRQALFRERFDATRIYTAMAAHIESLARLRGFGSLT